ncbi:MAG: hypothetical protein ACLPPF_21135 [Rhodomicrobium sp.]
MRKAKRKMTYAARKRLHARRIVRLCKMIAKKDVSKNLAAIVEDYIVTRLPAPLMRRLVRGDWGRPMREAMKLTVPFFA